MAILIYFATYFSDWGNATELSFGLLTVVLRIIWLVVIARDSKIFRTSWGYILLYLFLPYLLGLLGRLQHYSWAGIALTIGCVSVSFAYVIRFILKKEKGLLDWVKVIFVFGFFITSFLLQEYYIPKVFYNFRVALFYMLIFVFAYKKGDRKILKDELFSFENKNSSK